MGKVIEAIHVQELSDDSPDTSWLGEFTDKQSEWAIYRREGEYCHELESRAMREEHARIVSADCDCGQGDCETCNPQSYDNWAADYDGDSLYDFKASSREYTYFVPYAGGEKPGTDDYRKYGLQDWERMEGLQRGDWHFCGLRVYAAIRINGVSQRIYSGGLFGIESDDDDYRNEVIQEQLAELSGLLVELEFSQKQIDKAVNEVKSVAGIS